jgi:hypothetical protein
MIRQFASTPVHVKHVLSAAIPGMREHLAEEAIRMDWRRLCGPEFAHRSRAGALNNGVLEVIVDNSACLHEMKLRAGDVLEALQALHGPAVSSLRFSLGIASAARPSNGAERRSPPARRLPSEDARWIDAAIAPVAADPAVAGSLRRLLTKDLMARARARGNRGVAGA